MLRFVSCLLALLSPYSDTFLQRSEEQQVPPEEYDQLRLELSDYYNTRSLVEGALGHHRNHHFVKQPQSAIAQFWGAQAPEDSLELQVGKLQENVAFAQAAFDSLGTNVELLVQEYNLALSQVAVAADLVLLQNIQLDEYRAEIANLRDNVGRLTTVPFVYQGYNPFGEVISKQELLRASVKYPGSYFVLFSGDASTVAWSDASGMGGLWLASTIRKVEAPFAYGFDQGGKPLADPTARFTYDSSLPRQFLLSPDGSASIFFRDFSEKQCETSPINFAFSNGYCGGPMQAQTRAWMEGTEVLIIQFAEKAAAKLPQAEGWSQFLPIALGTSSAAVFYPPKAQLVLFFLGPEGELTSAGVDLPGLYDPVQQHLKNAVIAGLTVEKTDYYVTWSQDDTPVVTILQFSEQKISTLYALNGPLALIDEAPAMEAIYRDDKFFYRPR